MAIKSGLNKVQKTELEITISPSGEVSITVRGVKGKKCLELTAFLEEELGQITSRELTPDYYQPEEVSIKKQVKSR